jgi:hypothetical protein
MGTPILTRSGRTYISRMAGSLLTAVGLPDLITESLADYERLAITLGRNPARVASYKRYLAEQGRQSRCSTCRCWCATSSASSRTCWRRRAGQPLQALTEPAADDAFFDRWPMPPAAGLAAAGRCRRLSPGLDGPSRPARGAAPPVRDALLQCLVWLTRHHGKARSAERCAPVSRWTGRSMPEQAVRMLREAGYNATLLTKRIPEHQPAAACRPSCCWARGRLRAGSRRLAAIRPAAG